MLHRIKDYFNKVFVKEKIVVKHVDVVKTDLLQGKVAIVMGGTSGIGFSIAKKFVESGCTVYITGRNEIRLNEISDQLGVKALCMDLTNLDAALSTLSNFLDNNNVDILVNSAGYHGKGKFLSVTEDDWDNVLDVNLKGLYFMSQSVANHMISKKIKGHILNVSSASALKPSWSPYEISKRCVDGVTLGLADELIKYGIVVNGIAPGPTATPMLNFKSKDNDYSWTCNPSGRAADVEEIANFSLFLVSNIGDYVVGDTLYITGGSGTLDKR